VEPPLENICHARRDNPKVPCYYIVTYPAVTGLPVGLKLTLNW